MATAPHFDVRTLTPAVFNPIRPSELATSACGVGPQRRFYSRLMMIPLDQTTPSDFVGVDYTAFFQGPSVYDAKAIGDRSMDIIEECLTEYGLSSRRCFYGGRGATAGGPPFLEALLWVQEHWEFLAGAASVVLARVANVRQKWRQLKGKWEQRILDPYRPSVIVELALRTQGEGTEGQREAALSFRSLLSRVPDISQRLRNELPDQSFTIRVLSVGRSSARVYACFKVAEVRRSDVTRIVKFLNKGDITDDSVVSIYRTFGFLTRLEHKKDSNFMGSMTR